MSRFAEPRGAIRARTAIEFAFIFLFAYLVVQAAPVVVLRMNFLNELEVIAHSPIEESEALLRRKVLDTAEGFGITLLSEELHVRRDREASRTTIDVKYQLFVNFFPAFTYVWNVEDHVEALLL